MKKIPILLIGFRFLLTFIIPLIGFLNFESARIIMVVLVVLGLLSDVFDGIVARRLNVSTNLLRKMDSNVDIVFAIGVLFACFILNKQMLNYLPFIFVILVLELATYLSYWIKFRKQPSNHSYLTKCFGLLLFISSCAIIGWGNFILLPFLFGVAILSYLDGFAILISLKEYKVDNKSIIHVNKS